MDTHLRYMTRKFAWVHENVEDPRERDLERAKALSHAAKVSHRRNKSGRADRGGCTSTSTSPSAGSLSESWSQPATPLIAWKGNSDPFESTAVTITPRMSQAFEFLRDALIPGTHFNDGTKKSPWSRNFLPAKTMRKHVESMHDEWAALGEMLPLTAAISRLSGSQELQTETAKSKMKVIRRLQTEMSGLQDKLIRDHLIALTRTLFAAATFENNFLEARLHGIALRRLLDQKSSIEGIDSIEISLVWSSLYYDAQISHSTMQESIFDVDVWAPLAVRTATRPIIDFLSPQRPSIARSLDSSLAYSTLLTDVCVEIYQVMWLWARSEPLSPTIDGPMMNLYLTCSHNIFQLRLSNHFVRLRDAIDDNKTYEPNQLDRHTEAAVTLSLIAYLALFVGNPRIGGQYIWPRVRQLLSQLHHHLQQAGKSDQNCPQRMLLFAYWVGATWELNDAFATADVASWWFRQRFISTSKSLELDSWSAVKAVLDGFVPSRFAKPRGEVWVDDALEVAPATNPNLMTTSVEKQCRFELRGTSTWSRAYMRIPA